MGSWRPIDKLVPVHEACGKVANLSLEADLLILSVNLRVPKADQEKLRPHMETIVQSSRKEPGCLAYYYGFDLLEPDIIRVFEIYRDDAALKAHGESEHFKAWRAVSGQYARENRTLYDASVKG